MSQSEQESCGEPKLNLHDLAIEDAGKPHQHPKLEQYGDFLFIVARRPSWSKDALRLAKPTYSSAAATS